MDKLEKIIYSVKHLPSFLYFGSVGLIGYDIFRSKKLKKK